jgi:hypothetical protein
MNVLSLLTWHDLRMRMGVIGGAVSWLKDVEGRCIENFLALKFTAHTVHADVCCVIV